MKNIIALLSTFILIALVAFLVLLNEKSADVDIVKEENVSASIIDKDRVLMEYQPKKDNILFIFNGDAVLKYLYATVKEMNESDVVDIIVKGIITDVDYVYHEGLAYSILTVKVLDSYKDKCTKEIKVYEDGGYIKVKDMLDEFKSKGMDLENELSKEKIENGLVDMRIFNAPHSEKGQQVILYLKENEGPYFLANSYSVVSSVFGKFTLDKNKGQYERLGEDSISNFEKSMSEREMNIKLNNIK